MLDVSDLVQGFQFCAALPRFLRQQIAVEAARAEVGARLARPEQRFFARAQWALTYRVSSPYRELARLAGLELGDLARLVVQEGVDGTLQALYRAGVYLTVDEFKGRRPARRGSASLRIEPGSLRNPNCVYHLPAHSGGSRGGGSAILFDLRFIRDCAVDRLLYFVSRDGLNWQKAVWEVPGGGAMFRLLKWALLGQPPAAWFSQIPFTSAELHSRYRWSARAMVWTSRLAGRRLPGPIYAPVSNPRPVLDWMRQTLARGQTPYLQTFPSSAVSLARLALDDGISLVGVKLLVSGEPFTAARQRVIRAAGIEVLPRFGTMELGPIGYGCLHPVDVDDCHLLSDLHAVIQAPLPARDNRPAVDSLLVTPLTVYTPFVMLNVSLGDQAIVETRTCGCPMDHPGWGRHIRQIRSFEKLTAGGMTFLDSDVVRVLEEALPAAFGGGAGDYQLVESTREDGFAALDLVIHPRVGLLDHDAAIDCFLLALGRTDPTQRVMALEWRAAGRLRVVRDPPHATASGKILHLSSGSAGVVADGAERSARS